MGPNDLIGVGGPLVPGQEPVRLFDPADTFATDVPYVISDGRSLEAPVHVVDTNQETYTASDGSLQSTWGAPAPDMPPLSRDEPPNGVTNQGVPVTYNGAYVTNG